MKKKGRYKSGLKELRKSRKRYLANREIKMKVKIAEKKLKEAVDEGKIELAKKLLSEAFSVIDKAAKRRVFHPNKAARRKSRLSKLVNNLEIVLLQKK